MVSLRSKIGEKIQRIKYIANFRKRKKVNVFDWKESIDRIKKFNLSLCRYGDGELLMIFQYLNKGISTSTFQDYDYNLGEKLYHILICTDSQKCLVGLPHCMFGRGVRDMNFGARYFWERFTNKWIDTMLGILPYRDKNFADTNLTRFYNDFKSKGESRTKINKIKDIWSNRNILIVEGEKTRMGVGNDLFDNASSIRRILIPSVNAWSCYKEIFDSVLKYYNQGDLVLIAAGMTATVLAYDLSLQNIQSLDIGHLDIEYSWLNMGANARVKIEGKFTNEASDRNDVEECHDKFYLISIIHKIELSNQIGERRAKSQLMRSGGG